MLGIWLCKPRHQNRKLCGMDSDMPRQINVSVAWEVGRSLLSFQGSSDEAPSSTLRKLAAMTCNEPCSVDWTQVKVWTFADEKIQDFEARRLWGIFLSMPGHGAESRHLAIHEQRPIILGHKT